MEQVIRWSYKFGVILKFALEMEERAAEFYEAARNAAPSPERKSAGQEPEEHPAASAHAPRAGQRNAPGGHHRLRLSASAAAAETGADPEEIARHEETLRTYRRNFYRTAALKIEIVSPAVSQVFIKMAEAP